MADEAKKKLCIEVGQRIWQYRKDAGMTKEALAERMDITSQYLNDIEQGKKCMSMAYFVRLGQIFHISLDGAFSRRIRRSIKWCAACGRCLRWTGTWPST